MRRSTKQMQLDYWTGFAEFVSRNGEVVSATAPPYPQSFLVVVRSGQIGMSGFTLEAAMDTRELQIRVALELKGAVAYTEHYFDLLRRDRDAIEEEVGDKLVWHEPDGRRRRSVQRVLAADVWNRAGRREQYGWLLASAEAMHRVLLPRIRTLK